ncbi:hypothetical protein FZ983_06595 [Azospirillum sp. B21]|nr:hypothetical protein FZ983_06595 [Azospirillum sp. B21]
MALSRLFSEASRNAPLSPSPPRSRANFVCADATGGPEVRRKRGEGRGEGEAWRGHPENPRCAPPSP